ncbi:hypothetical protein [Bacillus sp. V5-8f]|uniref:hypothetical protein n=1 Tax=Bacillus sp. V5-8f TaxID=2053044 RepID=UPI000C764662|nr:hypothetical protein [Bacillus sp. V5-8f]PLT35123.1 hypothetical protein CUU64_07010 [Bacillus sp. V5-8f]
MLWALIKSQVKAGNNLAIANDVHLAEAVHLKASSVCWDWITATENAINNPQSNASTSKIIDEAGVDVGLGAVSLAGGVIAVSLMASIETPFIGVATIRFAASVAITSLFEGLS